MESFANPFAVGFAGRTLAYGVVRRFLSALFERANSPLWLVPAARKEMINEIEHRFRFEWYHRLEAEDPNNDRWTAADKVHIWQAVTSATREWLDNLLDSSDAIIRSAKLSEEETPSRSEILESLAEVDFPFEKGRGIGAERLHICECLHRRLRPVISSRSDTISHDTLNEWIPNEFRLPPGTSATLLEPEEAVAAITGRDSETIYETAIAIALPSPEPDPVAMDGLLRRTADALREGGLPRTASTVVFRYSNDPDPVATYARVWKTRPVRTRTAEERRLDLVAKRTAEVGYPDPTTKILTDPASRPPEPVPSKTRPPGGQFSLPRYVSKVAPQTIRSEQDLNERIHNAIVDAGYDPPDCSDDGWLLDDPAPPAYPATHYRSERLSRETRE